MPINNSHINYIVKDLNSRGLVYEPLLEDLLDHIYCGVESRMNKGMRFLDAYNAVLTEHFSNEEIIKIQKQTLQEVNKNSIIMIRNYIKIAFRNLRRHGFYSIINVTGLAVGIACCLMIVLFVQDELSYDKHHEKADRIYRVAADINIGGTHHQMATSPTPMAKTMVTDYPIVEMAGRFGWSGSYLVKREGDNIKESKVVYADNSILQIFTIPFIEGDSRRALEKPNSLVLSQSAAQRHFGDESPIGKQLTLQNRDLFQVTGVYEDMPKNSHFHFDFMLSMEGLDEAKSTSWLGNNYQTYFQLSESANIEEFGSSFAEMVNTYTYPQAEALLGTSLEDYKKSGQWVRYYAQPLPAIHLNSNLTWELEPNGDIKYVYIFSAIAMIIMIIACINFMNLSTARSANRAKEVGIRKVLGSYRSHLIKQFLTESILLSFLAMIIAIVLTSLALSSFNQLANKSLVIPFSEPMFWVSVSSAILLIGFVAGVYPSFFLSGFRPAQVLKGTLALGAKSGWLRSTLVVVQFCVSIFLIVGTLVINRQLNFIQNTKVGFDKEQVIIIENAYALDGNLEAYRNSLLQNANIVSATISSFLPVSSARSDSDFFPEGQSPDLNNSVSMQNWAIDYDYVETMGMEIIEGRNFSLDFPSDSSGIILNERAAELFGISDDPLGKRVFVIGDDSDFIYFEVVGIVKNFNYESLKKNIGALSFSLRESRGYISFRIDTENMPIMISALESKWKELGPGQPFQYSFLDDRFAKMYDAEQRVGNIAFTFSILAIFVACLGLFGLAAFTAQQRTKEIGVRKVLGASVSSILMLLSMEFGKLILIALVFAIPISWYFMDSWLQDFYYRINLGPGIFLYAGIITFVIAWLSMSWQSVKAAMGNPIDALKDE